MTTFQTANVGLGLSDYSTDATTPTTPRALTQSPIHSPPKAESAPAAPDLKQSAPNTPTNVSFAGVTGQRPLPTSPFANQFSSPQNPESDARPNMVHRGDSHQSVQSVESQDVEMGENDSGGEDVGSETESVDADGRPSKKKKGQRFFCTEFPPCKLSFTRSEHLARHIRKHTGERPFQCHCSRRFSRLDNLRQHAQTVHVNEEIPGDSLAATGTRFQRQIRTDRVAGARQTSSRPGTAGGRGNHSRGHSRNLSASSVGSMASTASTISQVDGRRRPPPLMMANDHNGRNRLSLDVLRSQASTPPGQASFFREESEGISTPTSTTFSTGQNSPGGYGSSMGSPTSAVPRGGGFWDGRSHARRLSVPSGPKPFQSPQNSYGSPYLSPLASSKASNFSSFGSQLGSPTDSTHMLSQQSGMSAAEELRRRTWHPSSHTYINYSRPATSGLTYYQTPDAPRPAFAPGATVATSQSNRLPGIETFDQIPRRPTTPPAYGVAPQQTDHAGRPPVYHGPSTQTNSGPDRRGHASWDMSLHHNLTKLDLTSAPPPTEQRQYQRFGMRPASEQMTQATYGPHVMVTHEAPKRPNEDSHYPEPTPNRSKRQGWYAGPPSVGQQPTSQPRTSPGDSSSSEGQPTTPSFSTAEHVPAIVHSNGYVESGQPQPAGAPNSYPTSNPPPPAWPLPSEPGNIQHSPHKDTEMSGLEVLVAVATREENATAAPNA